MVLLTQPEVWVLAGQDGQGEQAIDHIYYRAIGFYKRDRMPFRLTSAIATFQQLMETCLSDLNLNWCIIYLDDIIIFSKDLANHLARLEAMFQKLEEAGLKLKLSKCKLFQWQITYLEHIVSAQ